MKPVNLLDHQEVQATRQARANRQQTRGQSTASLSPFPSVSTPTSQPSSPTVASPSPSLTDSTTFHPSSTSFAVSIGRPASTPGNYTSLAHFIGGDKRIKGPLLNKVRPEASGLDTDDLSKPTATFLSRLGTAVRDQDGNEKNYPAETEGPMHARKGATAFALPGMTRPGSVPKGNTERLFDDRDTPALPMLSHPSALEKPKDIIIPSRSPSMPTYIKPPQASPLSSTSASRPPNPSPILAKKETSQSLSTNNIPDLVKVAERLPFNKDDLPKPYSIPSSSDTPSLTRLRGSSLVKERLKWGEQQASSGTSPSASPVNPPSVRARSQGDLLDLNSPPPLSSPKTESDVKNEPIQTEKSGYSSPINTSRAIKRSSVLDRYNPMAQAEASAEVKGSYKSSYGVNASPSPVMGQTFSQRASASAKAEGVPFPEQEQEHALVQEQISSKSPILGLGSEQATSSIHRDSSNMIARSDIDTENGFEESKRSEADYKASYGVGKPAARSLPPNSESPKVAEAVRLQGGSFTKSAYSPASISKPAQSNRAEPETYPPALAFPERSQSGSDYKASYGIGGAGGTVNQSPKSRSSPVPSFSKPSSSSTSPSFGGLPISVSPTPYQKSLSPAPRSPLSPNYSTAGAGVRSFQPSSSSFPVSLGLTPTHNRPMSLAHFIGGKPSITGPILNKQRPDTSESSTAEIDYGGAKGIGSFLSKNPNLLEEAAKRKGRVPLPGMVRPETSKPNEQLQTKELTDKTPTSPKLLPLPGMPSPELTASEEPEPDLKTSEALAVPDERTAEQEAAADVGRQTEIETGAPQFNLSPVSAFPSVSVMLATVHSPI